ncbi:LacI family transcriptional regulator [Kangsaoukella pontilimi]|uniref:LacI family transcriptional regulator n=1 Tax=Kangsaoukella pontilimi TaxID=2691042 RepID=UPI0029CA8383|nr:LacI family transcriptional regulator [Kangsaoukella pontilimi]
MASSIESPKKPTLRTISELSGLAVPTVSRALNDAPDIGKDTKARVREIAREIGYVPNRAGVRLRTGKTNVISLVLGTDNEVTDHTGQLVSSIARELRDTRYHMIVTPYFPDEDPMIPVRYIVETASADAVILNRVEVDDPRIAYLMERNFPFVCYGRSKWRDRHPYFDFDNETFGQIAARGLLARGCRAITILAPPEVQNYAQDMIRGARDTLAGSGASFEVLTGISGDDPGEVIQTRIAEYLQAHPDRDGLICPSTTAAIAAVVGAERIGRQIGTDLQVFAKEATPFLGYFRAPIGTARENVREAGSYLARAAIQAIERPDLPPMQKLVSATASDTVG